MDEKKTNEANDVEIEPLSDEALESASGGLAADLADEGSSNSCCSCSSCS
jgi:hypothetical protein